MSVQIIDYKKFIFPTNMSDEEEVLYRRFAKGLEYNTDEDGKEIPNNLTFFDGFRVVQIQLANDKNGGEILLRKDV